MMTKNRKDLVSLLLVEFKRAGFIPKDEAQCTDVQRIADQILNDVYTPEFSQCVIWNTLDVMNLLPASMNHKELSHPYCLQVLSDADCAILEAGETALQAVLINKLQSSPL